jgi:hypothetical protein
MKQLLIIAFFFTSFTVMAQEPERFLSIKISTNLLKANDTLSIEANYVDDFNEPRNGTLYLKILNETGSVWKYRWPIVKGFSYPQLVIPTTIQNGNYYLYFATRNEAFQIKGKLIENEGIINLNASLSNKDFFIVTSDIAVNYENNFIYEGVRFDEEAMLKILNANKQGGKPNIKIQAILDSAFTPTASAYTKITIGTTLEKNTTKAFPKKYNELDTFLNKGVYKAAIVTVKAAKKKFIEDFTDKYVGNAFRGMTDKELNVIDDNPGRHGLTAIQYLQQSVGSLAFNKDSSGDDIVTWRGQPMYFYLDEVEVSSDYLSSIDLDEIAIVKIYQPNFPSNLSGLGGAIAFYTRRDGNSGNKRAIFKIKGYNKLISTL